MFKQLSVLTASLGWSLCFSPLASANDDTRIEELNRFWAEVSRTVKEGDFDGYAATCHEEGVLVAGDSKKCHPLTMALARWKRGFEDTQAGKMKASVKFRFSQRLGDATTAHETGIFVYSSTNAEGTQKDAYVHFEALLLKKKAGWKIVMEYQKSEATPEEWAALK